MGRTWWLLAALAVAGVPAMATTEERPPDPLDDPVLLAMGALDGHPDLLFRQWGMNALRKKQYDRAMAYFRRASFHADKPSQGMIAEMLWNGTGVARDRAAAYAWMDLAAERGYPLFAIQREKYWQALTEAERASAIEEGQQLYARFGDSAAKPRYAARMRWQQKEATGSRLGSFAGASVKATLPGMSEDSEGISVDASKLHDKRYWDTDKYWEDTDRLWGRLRTGTVRVGELERVDEATESRIPEVQPDEGFAEPETPPTPDEEGASPSGTPGGR